MVHVAVEGRYSAAVAGGGVGARRVKAPRLPWPGCRTSSFDVHTGRLGSLGRGRLFLSRWPAAWPTRRAATAGRGRFCEGHG